MKKKIKDLTLEESDKICDKYIDCNDLVMIVYYEEYDRYVVMNIRDVIWTIIWLGDDLETAKIVKKAYCDGYNYRKNEEQDND